MRQTRTALVTGASRGIGRSVAESLACRGFGLTITSRREQDLAVLADRLTSMGAAGVVHAPSDLSDRTTLAALVDLHAATYGAMNALILSAGVGTSGDLAGYPLDRLDKTFAVNVVAPALLVQAALPLLRAGAQRDIDHGATIIGLGSIAGVYAERGLAVYGASKSALISMMATVNAEESHRGVKASTIAPGYVDTDMSAWAHDSVPPKTMIQVADVVSVVELLLGLGRQAVIPSVVLTRAGTTGYEA